MRSIHESKLKNFLENLLLLLLYYFFVTENNILFNAVLNYSNKWNLKIEIKNQQELYMKIN